MAENQTVAGNRTVTSWPVDERHVTRAIVWNQALWTVGHSLTTGGLFAGVISGLLGGRRLFALQNSETEIKFAGWDITPFQLLFLISWIGRVAPRSGYYRSGNHQSGIRRVDRGARTD